MNPDRASPLEKRLLRENSRLKQEADELKKQAEVSNLEIEELTKAA
ncbi:hypothetical protein CAC42_7797 [Sphaceloma murrayae]|uniref:Uncharacterized protein n=1 Tax=Sphaceloma murrayae TaxID=2082308 RepID=A0A2K1QXW1_9PEZI|nr:hypothetical protein CAC42_7797 [Sphaceloma murrayae]